MKLSKLSAVVAATVLTLALAGSAKVEAADSLQITVTASVETVTIAWNSAGTDTAGKSWDVTFANFGDSDTSSTYNVYNKNSYAQDHSVSASAAGPWTLAGSTGAANAAVLKVGGTSVHATPRTYTNVSAAANSSFDLELTAPASGSTSSGDITVTVTASKN